MAGNYPVIAPKPKPDDSVQLLITQSALDALVEQFFTPRGVSLSPALLFSEDDLPTYTIGINPNR